MIKSAPITVNLNPYKEDFQISTIRAHKYYGFVKQFKAKDATSHLIFSRFLQKLKKAKLVKTYKVSPSTSDMNLERMKSVLKFHSQDLRELDISDLPKISTSNKSFLCQMKKLKRTYIPNDMIYIKSLSVLLRLEDLLIKIQSNEEKAYLKLSKILINLKNLKNFCSLINPNCLEKTLNVLNQVSLRLSRAIKFQIMTKDKHNYNGLPDFSPTLRQKITKISLKNLNSESILEKVFSQTFHYLNLRTLKLQFSIPDVELDPYLKNLKQLTFLERLSLSFPECWDTEPIEEFLKHLQFPSKLQDLKLVMPIFLKDHLINYGYDESNEENKRNYAWRRSNFFEKESIFSPFFQTLEQLNCLKNIELDFQLIETFNSYFTNFFVSILNRLPNISSFILNLIDCNLQEDSTHKRSEPFDLALFFEACSRIKNLENIQIVVPNLLFEDANIGQKMNHLKSLTIGITEREEEDQENNIKLLNISRHISRWLKRLASMAPNLKNLLFDFVEVIDEYNFCKRFTMIERFKELETICSKFIIHKCTTENAKKIGKMVQSLQKLKFLVLEFTESDKNVLEMRKYLNYHRSIRDLLFSFEDMDWIGKDDESEYED